MVSKKYPDGQKSNNDQKSSTKLRFSDDKIYKQFQ